MIPELELIRSEGFPWVYPLLWGVGRWRNALDAATESGAGLIFLCRNGEGECELSGRVVSLSPGAIVCVPEPGELVLPPASSGTCLYALLGNAASLLEGLYAFRPDEQSGVRQTMERLYFQFAENKPKDIHAASVEIYSLLMDLRRTRSPAKPAHSRLVEDAIELIGRDFAFLQGVGELAERLEVTDSHLIRKFTQEVGVGPGRFLQITRLEQAKLLLATRDYGVEMIAGMLGYSCANYFCKVFRREFGLTPGTYRRKQRSSAAAREPEARFRVRDFEGYAQV